jgi:hypothetical protein
LDITPKKKANPPIIPVSTDTELNVTKINTGWETLAKVMQNTKFSGVQSRKRRKLNYMHLKLAKLVQKPPSTTPQGLGKEQHPPRKVPQHMIGNIGYLGGQIKDPFERITKEQKMKRRTWRREYLATVDTAQVEDLIL